MHGLGATSDDFAGLVPELDLEGCQPIRFVFPQAPSIPITINGGYVMPGWYDLYGMDLVSKQDAAGIQRSEAAIAALVDREVSRGIPYERIVLAGFSQGSAHRTAPAAQNCWCDGLVRLPAAGRSLCN
jgi:phospholipase/carboxylesterase